MSDSVALNKKEIIELSSNLTCAYLAKNDVQLNDVATVISTFFQVLSDLNRSIVGNKSRLPLSPAVSIENSVGKDYIICLEDGKKLQMLKRHLSTVYKMTIEEYKERWGLPADYPVVAPSYALRRSEIAKSTGLGRSSNKKKLKVVDAKVGSAVFGK